MSDTDKRIDYAQAQCVEQGLSASQCAGVLAYLLGAILTHFDQPPGAAPLPLLDSRWHRLVRDAIAAQT